jgi:hypothetical protein
MYVDELNEIIFKVSCKSPKDANENYKDQRKEMTILHKRLWYIVHGKLK